MGDKLGVALSWWGYLSSDEQNAVIEMVYKMTNEDMELHGLLLNKDEELYLREV